VLDENTAAKASVISSLLCL